MPPVPDKRYYDNSALSAYKKCPRSYQLRHVLGWRGTGTALPLIFGLSWHSAMEVVWQHAKTTDKETLPRMALAKFLETWEENGLPAELSLEDLEVYKARTPMTALAMLTEYCDQRWHLLQTCELVANEQPFAVPLPEMNSVWYIGRIDKVARIQGALKAIEHKTTSDYQKEGGFKYSYVDSWFSDSQTKGYQFGGGMFYPGLTEVWVDAALVHKTVHDKFRFIPVAHKTPLLDEWLVDTRDWIGRLERDKATGYFPKNEESCIGRYGSCQFISFCRTVPDNAIPKEPPEGWTYDPWEPFEILGLDKLLGKPQQENTDE